MITNFSQIPRSVKSLPLCFFDFSSFSGFNLFPSFTTQIKFAMILNVYFLLQFTFRFLVNQTLFFCFLGQFRFSDLLFGCSENRRNVEKYWVLNIFIDCSCCTRDILKLKAKTMLLLLLSSLF